MPISIEELKKIAQLARIELSPEEEARHAQTISAVLDYMKILNEVETDGVEPTSQVTGLEDVARQDEPRNCKIIKELMAQMPEIKDNELAVPGVFSDLDEEL